MTIQPALPVFVFNDHKLKVVTDELFTISFNEVSIDEFFHLAMQPLSLWNIEYFHH